MVEQRLLRLLKLGLASARVAERRQCATQGQVRLVGFSYVYHANLGRSV
jgi:hypothetical protein